MTQVKLKTEMSRVLAPAHGVDSDLTDEQPDCNADSNLDHAQRECEAVRVLRSGRRIGLGESTTLCNSGLASKRQFLDRVDTRYCTTYRNEEQNSSNHRRERRSTDDPRIRVS